MKLNNDAARLFVPDIHGGAFLARTTDLCIAAHQDDIEIMAYAPVVECYEREDRWFTGVTVTGTDNVRAGEQELAAAIGRYNAQIQLGYSSGEVKNPDNPALINELRDVILACSPDTVYTHNLADKHDTHVAVVLNVIRALRLIAAEKRPKRVYSMEGWRGLDWLCDEDKTVFDTSRRPHLSAALIGVYDSQVTPAKRYDLAAEGRRLANAVFLETHGTGGPSGLSFGLDITELIADGLDPLEYINRYIDRFRADAAERVKALS
jgi:LmbE family N-acetylglucosaminyl deacetylase